MNRFSINIMLMSTGLLAGLCYFTYVVITAILIIAGLIICTMVTDDSPDLYDIGTGVSDD